MIYQKSVQRYNIRGYYDMGKFVVNLSCYIVIIHWSVRSSIRRVGQRVKGVERRGYLYFSQLENQFIRLAETLVQYPTNHID